MLSVKPTVINCMACTKQYSASPKHHHSQQGSKLHHYCRDSDHLKYMPFLKEFYKWYAFVPSVMRPLLISIKILH